MALVALFHSALGVTPGIDDAAARLRTGGHEVHVVDYYGGRVFDDYDPAVAHVDEVGFPALMAAALDGVSDLPDGFVPAGFSNGAGLAQYVAGQRRVSGAVMLSGAIDPAYLETTWPPGVPAQIHTTVDDPWRDEGIEAAAAAVEAAGATVEVFDYPGSGHLFADPSRADEYQPEEAELMWSRVLAFLERVAP